MVAEVSIEHKKSWRFKLKPGQVRKIKIYPGDVIVSDSRYRYYVDNTLLEANNRYKHTRSTEGFLVFKPSVDPKEIRVWVKNPAHRRSRYSRENLAFYFKLKFCSLFGDKTIS